MRRLITNDDGYQAKGIKVLAEIMILIFFITLHGFVGLCPQRKRQLKYNFLHKLFTQ